tara:strand:- start:331 stop:660 length:330 start_codon:yes stop_codon:yes gene_type:complete
MNLTIADIGVISGIMFSFSTVIWVIHKSNIISLNKALERNCDMDEKRNNGLGYRIDKLTTDIHELEVKSNEKYADKKELAEVKKELKLIEKTICKNHLELMTKLNESKN